MTTGQQNLREIAIARLLLDNFPHIKAFWIMITPQVAQLALWYGADDLDGTVSHYEITHALGTASHRQALSHQELLDLISEAGRVPVELDALYNVIREQTSASPSAVSSGPNCSVESSSRQQSAKESLNLRVLSSSS
ncbi:MAG: Radical SAM domain protein [candidate division NC10 bacterium]|nr:Radical SAM domain protein [candidate division NC10 bacterium]